jgi:xanthine dehydrogenase accessory factor
LTAYSQGVYEIAKDVVECLQAGTAVDLAWVIETRGFSSREPTEALAVTSEGRRMGTLLSGSLDDQIVAGVRWGASRTVVDVHVADSDAQAAGLSCGGHARCLVVPATELPGELWHRLSEHEPVCLVTRLHGNDVAGTALFTPATIGAAGEQAAQLFRRGLSVTAVAADTVVTALWPVPTVVIVGAGGIADSLVTTADMLGWRTEVVDTGDAAMAAVADRGVLDMVVVLSHDLDVGGPALAAALSSPVGYIGAIGSRATQNKRADWLASGGFADLSRIHGPAGLDIGATTPGEVAVSVVAEALAVRSGRRPISLRDRPGPVHASRS